MVITDTTVKVAPCIVCGLKEPQDPIMCGIGQGHYICSSHALVCAVCGTTICSFHATIDDGDEDGDEDEDDLIGKTFCDECLNYWTSII